MNATQMGVVTLLKSAITGKQYPLPEAFSIEEAYPLVKRHHMSTLIYVGAMCCGISQKTPVMQQLFLDYCNAMIRSEGQMASFSQICQAFEVNHIDYMPLKGCKMKVLYPKPELRVMGDADILIRMEQYEQIIPIVMSLGFRNIGNSDHELIWTNGKLLLELHKRVIPSYNKDFYAYFGDGWEIAKNKDGNCYSMSPEDEWIYLFTHFAKHYRDGGIGCRHVVDLWVYLRANPTLDENYIKAALAKLQILEFYENIRKLLNVWFSQEETSQKIDFITDFIFDSGSWGKSESRVVSVGVRNKGNTGNPIKSRLKYIFPDAKLLNNKFPILQKAPWMLPVIWVIRPFRTIFVERRKVSVLFKRYKALSPENLKTRQDALNYVGLNYNF